MYNPNADNKADRESVSNWASNHNEWAGKIPHYSIPAYTYNSTLSGNTDSNADIRDYNKNNRDYVCALGFLQKPTLYP